MRLQCSRSNWNDHIGFLHSKPPRCFSIMTLIKWWWEKSHRGGGLFKGTPSTKQYYLRGEGSTRCTQTDIQVERSKHSSIRALWVRMEIHLRSLTYTGMLAKKIPINPAAAGDAAHYPVVSLKSCVLISLLQNNQVMQTQTTHERERVDNCHHINKAVW